MNMIRKNGGFTLVELIVVIAILAILAGAAVPAYSGYIKSAYEAGDTTQLAAIKTAAMAATATEGAVTEITVTTDASTGKVSGILVKYEGNTTGVAVLTSDGVDNTDVDDDFNAFWGVASAEYPVLKSDEFKGGAKWSSTGTNAGEWVKNP